MHHRYLDEVAPQAVKRPKLAKPVPARQLARAWVKAVRAFKQSGGIGAAMARESAEQAKTQRDG